MTGAILRSVPKSAVIVYSRAVSLSPAILDDFTKNHTMCGWKIIPEEPLHLILRVLNIPMKYLSILKLRLILIDFSEPALICNDGSLFIGFSVGTRELIPY
jgi:hypothetical protein